MPALQITDTGIVIHDVLVESRDVAAYFCGVSDSERLPALERVIQVGVFCLERAQTAQDLEFVKRQVEGLLASVQHSVSGIPGPHNLSRVLDVLARPEHRQAMRAVFDALLKQMGEAAPDLGKNTAGDSTALAAKAKKGGRPSRRRSRRACRSPRGDARSTRTTTAR